MHKHILWAVFLMFFAITSFSCRGGNNTSATVPTPGVPLPPPSSGNLDTSFGIDGKVTVISNSLNESVVSLLLQSDGKTIVVSSSNTGTSNASYLSRYTLNGTPDTSFGTNGRIIMDTKSTTDIISSAIIQPDGKIVAVGSTTNTNLGIFAVIRYNPDGTLDTSFGTGGKVTTNVRSQSTYERASAVGIQNDGKIVVIGPSYSSSTGVKAFAAVRYNTDGTLDPTFGTNGKVSTTIGTNNDSPVSVAIQPDGKIVVAGNVTEWNEGKQYIYFAAVRYNEDGSPDSSFGSGGKVITAIGPRFSIESSMAIQPDGKIILAGTAESDFAVVRYNNDGSPDPSFGVGGKVTTPIIEGSDDNGLSLVLQSDGKILVAGQSVDNENGYISLVRYNPDGSIDTSFGNQGRIATVLGSSSHYSSFTDFDLITKFVFHHSLALQSDNKIIATGPSFNDTESGFTILRYEPASI